LESSVISDCKNVCYFLLSDVYSYVYITVMTIKTRWN